MQDSPDHHPDIGPALADLAQQAASVLWNAARAIVMLLPVALRLVCVGAAIAGAVYSWPRAWSAFGGDVPAMLPASAVVLVPLAWSLMAGLSWGGLLFAGLVTAGAGALLAGATSTTRALAVAGILAAICFYFAGNGSPTLEESDNEQEQR